MKKALLLLADGCEEIEAVTIVDILRRGQVQVTIAGLTKTTIVGAHEIQIEADTTFAEIESVAQNGGYDLIVLPGGLPGTYHLRDDQRVIALLQQQAKQGKKVAAICAAPLVLAHAGLLENQQATCYPGSVSTNDFPQLTLTTDPVVISGNVITGRSPGVAMEFALEVLRLLSGQAIHDEVLAGLAKTA